MAILFFRRSLKACGGKTIRVTTKRDARRRLSQRGKYLLLPIVLPSLSDHRPTGQCKSSFLLSDLARCSLKAVLRFPSSEGFPEGSGLRRAGGSLRWTENA